MHDLAACQVRAALVRMRPCSHSRWKTSTASKLAGNSELSAAQGCRFRVSRLAVRSMKLGYQFGRLSGQPQPGFQQ